MSRAGCFCFLGQFKGIIIYTSQCILQSFEVILESPILKNLTVFLQLVIAVYVWFFFWNFLQVGCLYCVLSAGFLQQGTAISLENRGLYPVM